MRDSPPRFGIDAPLAPPQGACTPHALPVQAELPLRAVPVPEPPAACRPQPGHLREDPLLVARKATRKGWRRWRKRPCSQPPPGSSSAPALPPLAPCGSPVPAPRAPVPGQWAPQAPASPSSPARGWPRAAGSAARRGVSPGAGGCLATPRWSLRAACPATPQAHHPPPATVVHRSFGSKRPGTKGRGKAHAAKLAWRRGCLLSSTPARAPRLSGPRGRPAGNTPRGG
mmetsp:Transcript_66447/g.158545  ORF Transcript_66447/g.158545 Transcript_66447/m.158545 type:complete len:228 (-) Transcript_66447:380-1063(-)